MVWLKKMRSESDNANKKKISKYKNGGINNKLFVLVKTVNCFK